MVPLWLIVTAVALAIYDNQIAVSPDPAVPPDPPKPPKSVDTPPSDQLPSDPTHANPVPATEPTPPES